LASTPSRNEVERLHRLMMQASTDASQLDKRVQEEQKSDGLSAELRHWHDAADAMHGAVERVRTELLRDGTSKEQVDRIRDRLRELKDRSKRFDIENDLEGCVQHWKALGREFAQLTGKQRDPLVRLLESRKSRVDQTTSVLSSARKTGGMLPEKHAKVRGLQAQRDDARARYERLRQKYLEAERDHQAAERQKAQKAATADHQEKKAPLPNLGALGSAARKGPVLVRLPDPKAADKTAQHKLPQTAPKPGALGQNTPKAGLHSLPPPPAKPALPKSSTTTAKPPAERKKLEAKKAGEQKATVAKKDEKKKQELKKAQEKAAKQTAPLKPGMPGYGKPQPQARPGQLVKPGLPGQAQLRAPSNRPMQLIRPGFRPGSLTQAQQAHMQRGQSAQKATGPARISLERIERAAGYPTGVDGIGRGSQSAAIWFRAENLPPALSIQGTTSIQLGCAVRLDVMPSVQLFSAVAGAPLKGKLSLLLISSGGRLGTISPKSALGAAKDAARAGGRQVAGKLGVVGKQLESAIVDLLDDAADKIFRGAQSRAPQNRLPPRAAGAPLKGPSTEHHVARFNHALGGILNEARAVKGAPGQTQKLLRHLDRDHHDRDSVAGRLEQTLSHLATAAHRTLTDSTAGELRSHLARMDAILSRLRGKAGPELSSGAQEITEILQRMGGIAASKGGAPHINEFRKLVEERRGQLQEIGAEARRKTGAEAMKVKGLLHQMPSSQVLGEKQLALLRRQHPGIEKLLKNASHAQLSAELGKLEKSSLGALLGKNKQRGKRGGLGTHSLTGAFQALGGGHLGGFGGGHRTGALGSLSGVGGGLGKVLEKQLEHQVKRTRPQDMGKLLATFNKAPKGTPLHELAKKAEEKQKRLATHHSGKRGPAASAVTAAALLEVFKEHPKGKTFASHLAPGGALRHLCEAAQRGHGLPISSTAQHYLASRGHSHVFNAVAQFNTLVKAGHQPHRRGLGTIGHSSNVSRAVSSVSSTVNRATSSISASNAARAGISSFANNGMAMNVGRGMIGRVVQRGVGAFRNVAQRVGPGAMNVASRASGVNFARGEYDRVSNLAQRAYGSNALHAASGGISSRPHGLWNAAKAMGGGLWGSYEGVGQGIWGSIKQRAQGLSNLSQRGLSAVQSAPSWVQNKAGAAIDWTKQKSGAAVEAETALMEGSKFAGPLRGLEKAMTNPKTRKIGGGLEKTGGKAVKGGIRVSGKAAKAQGVLDKVVTVGDKVHGALGQVHDLAPGLAEALGDDAAGRSVSRVGDMAGKDDEKLSKALEYGHSASDQMTTYRGYLDKGLGFAGVKNPAKAYDKMMARKELAAGKKGGLAHVAQLKLDDHKRKHPELHLAEATGKRTRRAHGEPRTQRRRAGGTPADYSPSHRGRRAGGTPADYSPSSRRKTSPHDARADHGGHLPRKPRGGNEPATNLEQALARGKGLIKKGERVADSVHSGLGKVQGVVEKGLDGAQKVQTGLEKASELARQGAEILGDDSELGKHLLGVAARADQVHGYLEQGIGLADEFNKGVGKAHDLTGKIPGVHDDGDGESHGHGGKKKPRRDGAGGHDGTPLEYATHGGGKGRHAGGTDADWSPSSKKPSPHDTRPHGGKTPGVPTPAHASETAAQKSTRLQHAWDEIGYVSGAVQRFETTHARAQRKIQEMLAKGQGNAASIELIGLGSECDEISKAIKEAKTLSKGNDKYQKEIAFYEDWHHKTKAKLHAGIADTRGLGGPSPHGKPDPKKKTEDGKKKPGELMKSVDGGLKAIDKYRKKAGKAGRKVDAHLGKLEHALQKGGQVGKKMDSGLGKVAGVADQLSKALGEDSELGQFAQQASDAAGKGHEKLNDALGLAAKGKKGLGKGRELFHQGLAAAAGHHEKKIEKIHGKKPANAEHEHGGAHPGELVRHAAGHDQKQHGHLPKGVDVVVHDGKQFVHDGKHLWKDGKKSVHDVQHGVKDLKHGWGDAKSLFGHLKAHDWKGAIGDGKHLVRDISGLFGSGKRSPHDGPVGPHHPPHHHHKPGPQPYPGQQPGGGGAAGLGEAEVGQLVQGAMEGVTGFGKAVTARIEEIERLVSGGQTKEAGDRVQSLSGISEQTRYQVTRAVSTSARYPALHKQAQAASKHYLEIRKHFFSFMKGLHGLGGKTTELEGVDGKKYPDLLAISTDINGLQVKVSSLGELKHADTPMQGAAGDLKKEAASLRGRVHTAQSADKGDAPARQVVQGLSDKLARLERQLGSHSDKGNVAQGDKALGIQGGRRKPHRPRWRKHRKHEQHDPIDDVLNGGGGTIHVHGQGGVRDDMDVHDGQDVDPAAMDTWIGSGEGMKLFSEVFGAFIPAEGAVVHHHVGGGGRTKPHGQGGMGFEIGGSAQRSGSIGGLDAHGGAHIGPDGIELEGELDLGVDIGGHHFGGKIGGKIGVSMKSIKSRLGKLIPRRATGFFKGLFDHLHGFADRIAGWSKLGGEMLGKGMHYAEMGMHGLSQIEDAAERVQGMASKAEGFLNKLGLGTLGGFAGKIGGAARWVGKESQLLHGGLETADQWMGKGKEVAGQVEGGAERAGGIFEKAEHGRFGALLNLFKASKNGTGIDGKLVPEKMRLGSQFDEPRRLDVMTMSRMEGFLGGDFAGVRIHTGPGAAAVTHRFAAEAVTVKDHIFFAPGRFNPSSTEGQRLLAHELTHVLQKGRANLDVRTAEREALHSEHSYGYGNPQMETLNLSQPQADFRLGDGEGLGSASGVYTAKRNRSRGHEAGGKDTLPDGEEFLEQISTRVYELLMEELEHAFESR